MTDRFKSDRRLDPRQVPILEGIDMVISKFGDVASRDEALAVVNSPEELMKSEGMKAMMEGADDEAIVPSAGLRIETKSITSAPDGNTWICNLSAQTPTRHCPVCSTSTVAAWRLHPALMRITELGAR